MALLFASGCPPKPAAEVPPANPLVVPAVFTAADAAVPVNPVVPDAAVVAVDGGPLPADGGVIDGSAGDGGAAAAPAPSP